MKLLNSNNPKLKLDIKFHFQFQILSFTNLKKILLEMSEPQLEFSLKFEEVRPLLIDVWSLGLKNLLKLIQCFSSVDVPQVKSALRSLYTSRSEGICIQTSSYKICSDRKSLKWGLCIRIMRIPRSQCTCRV